MIPILVCTHGESAAKLVESAEMIAGKQNECQTVKFKMGESLDLLKKILLNILTNLMIQVISYVL
jgi:Phosphotransferase system, mannose/fructose-specific component IIA